MLPERLSEAIRRGDHPTTAVVIGPGFSLDAHLRAVEARLLGEALERAAGDRAEAARLLGVKPRALRYLLYKHGGDRN
ncbi:MAG: hypothetical protein A2V74_01645 [Acidobacteria bacterium RBG_16_70_10]|nr:MAG: hypothetical protein A2V74_01645 [Acidobacteria bacterium RBG_16_70_10]